MNGFFPLCLSYLADNPDLLEMDSRSVALRNMPLEKKIHIDAVLESHYTYWLGQGYCDREVALCCGGLYAFRGGDYTCSLIYRHLKSIDISKALRVKDK